MKKIPPPPQAPRPPGHRLIGGMSNRCIASNVHDMILSEAEVTTLLEGNWDSFTEIRRNLVSKYLIEYDSVLSHRYLPTVHGTQLRNFLRKRSRLTYPIKVSLGDNNYTKVSENYTNENE